MSIFAKKEASAKELSAALADIDLEALTQAVATATDERTKLLIDGSDQEIAEVESRLTSARLELDRATARKGELARRLIKAEQREADAKLEADRAKVEKQADHLAKHLKERYIAAAGPLVRLLTELEAAEKAVYDVNQQLGERGWLADGRAKQIAPIERRAFDFGLDADRVASILSRTSLREYRLPNGHLDQSIPSWPPAIT
jgi:chromosome segregation ATPase